MADTQIATATWSGFYNGGPWLNQDNWVNFFYNAVPDGVKYPDYKNGDWGALTPYFDGNGTLKIKSGGGFNFGYSFWFEYLGTDMVLPAYTSGVRMVHVTYEPVTKVPKLMVSDVDDNAATAVENVFASPRRYCGRNLPICLQTSAEDILDLRPFMTSRGNFTPQKVDLYNTSGAAPSWTTFPIGAVKVDQGGVHAVTAYGGTTMYVDLWGGSVGNADIYPASPVPSQAPIVLTIGNRQSVNATVTLKSKGAGYTNEYAWTDGWTQSGTDWVKTIPANSSLTVILTLAYAQGTTVRYTVQSGS